MRTCGGLVYWKKLGVRFFEDKGWTGDEGTSDVSCFSDTSYPISKANKADI
jgi:hypothetical protein